VAVGQTLAVTNDTYVPYSFTVEGGVLAVSYAYPLQPLFRFDAMADTFEGVYEEDDKTFFTRWNDADGNGAYATTLFVSGKTCTNATLVTATTATGVERRVVNFGRDNSTQATLALNKNYTNVREALAIYADNNGNQNIFGHGGSYHYLRAWNPYNGLIQPYSVSQHAAMYGYIAVDGTEQPYSYVLPSGFHLVEMAPTNATAINRMASDRDSTLGRCYIGEQIAFSNAFTTTRRAAVTAALRKKWFDVGEGAVWTNFVADIAVAGGTLSIGCSDGIVPDSMFAAESVSGSGAVDVPGALSAALVASDGELSVAGDLVLPDGASVVVAFDEDGVPAWTAVSGSLSAEGAVNVSFDAATAARPAIGKYPIFAAASLDGTAPAEWTLGELSRRNASISAEDGVVYLSIVPHGLMIMVQ